MSQKYSNLPGKQALDKIIAKIEAGDRPEEKDTFIRLLDIGEELISKHYIDAASINAQETIVKDFQEVLVLAAANAAFKKGESTLSEQDINDLVSAFSVKDYTAQTSV